MSRSRASRGGRGLLKLAVPLALVALTIFSPGSTFVPGTKTGPLPSVYSSGDADRSSPSRAQQLARVVRHAEEGAGAPRSHGAVANAAMGAMQMPSAPADPLEWSVEQVTKANFMTSAAYAASLCRAIEDGKAGPEHAARLSAMLGHSDGARGFFVTYLTDPALKASADSPSGLAPLVQEALRGADAAVVTPLAVMNLVMPTATAMSHRANGDAQSASNSERTASRGAKVLEVLLSTPSTVGAIARQKLEAAREAATGSSDEIHKEWVSFFNRWKYNEEQMGAIRKALDGVLASPVH